MKSKRIEILSKEELQTIHNSTLELLNTIGVKVESEEAISLLKQNGAFVDHPTNKYIVRFPEELVKEQLKKVPKNFTLWGIDETFSFTVDTETTHFATVGTPIKIYDPLKKSGVRKSVLSDTINQIRIVDSLKNIICSHADVWPNDVPYLQLHYYGLLAWAKNSTKPYGLGCYGRVASQDMMDITSVLVGGDDNLISKPRLIGFFNPTSPLMLTRIMLNGLFIFAKYKQPVIIAPAAGAGSTAPVTLAGLLLQTNIETLSSIVLTQLINPGAPLFYSTMSAPMDPSTGNVAWGSIETGLITSGAAQLARFYEIPSRGPGAVTESKCFDIQNGFERFLTLYYAANSGINYITCAGTYESSLSEALELLVIDDELIDIIKRGKQGINLDDNKLAVEEIKRVFLEDKSFLALRHTAKNTRRELFVPKLANRERRGKWQRDGSKDIILAAKDRVDEILSNHKERELTSEIKVKLDELLKVISKRTMDDFRIAEDLEESSSAIGIKGPEE